MMPIRAVVPLSIPFSIVTDAVLVASDNLTSAPLPWATVVIVAYNAGDLLEQCLEALARQTMSDFEAVIVDNASTDGSIEKLRLPDERFRLVSARANLGFAGGTNLGIRAGSAPWIAALNPDAVAAPDWLAQLRKASERHPGVVMFGSTQIDGKNPDRLDGCGDHLSFLGVSWRGCYGYPIDAVPPEGETFSPCAAAALYRRDIVEKIGGFDERFFCYAEDVDLAFRIRLEGGICVQVPAAAVNHIGSAITGLRSHFTVFHSARNRVWLMIKNLPLPLLIPLLPLHVIYRLLSLVLHLTERSYVSATLSGLRAAWKGIAPVLKERKDIQARRKVGTAAVARMLCWNPITMWRRGSDIRQISAI